MICPRGAASSFCRPAGQRFSRNVSIPEAGPGCSVWSAGRGKPRGEDSVRRVRSPSFRPLPSLSVLRPYGDPLSSSPDPTGKVTDEDLPRCLYKNRGPFTEVFVSNINPGTHPARTSPERLQAQTPRRRPFRVGLSVPRSLVPDTVPPGPWTRSLQSRGQESQLRTHPRSSFSPSYPLKTRFTVSSSRVLLTLWVVPLCVCTPSTTVAGLLWNGLRDEGRLRVTVRFVFEDPGAQGLGKFQLTEGRHRVRTLGT